MVLIISTFLVPKGFRGMTVFPFVFLRDKTMATQTMTVNHERIHLRQQLELLVLPFFIWYFLEFLVRLLLYRNRNKAYRNICFEREAYANEKDLEYLNSRPIWKFVKYWNY